jgi:hypothetical protein
MGLTRGQAFPSNFVGKEDLIGGSVVCTIQSVDMEPIKSDGGTEDKVVIHFHGENISAGRNKPMICNNTNWQTLEAAYGPDTDSWLGQATELFFDPNVMFGKDRTGGTRIRIPAKGVAAPAAQPPAAAPTGLPWATAVEMAAQQGMDADALKAALKARGLTSYNSVRDEAVTRLILAAAVVDLPF